MSVFMKKFTNIFGVQKPWTATGDVEKFFQTLGATEKQIKEMKVNS